MQLAVIAKEPVPGHVKTRLCPPFTREHAALLARSALRDTLLTVLATPAARHVLVLDGRPGPWLPEGFDVVVQRGAGLGERLQSAFTDCARTCHEPIVLVGMDTPQLRPSLLLRAGAALEAAGTNRTTRRAVIGPATDGGYWLIGLSHVGPNVFHGVTMSSPQTFHQQVAKLHAHGFAIAVIDELLDVDTADAAAEVAALAPTTEFARCFQSLDSRLPAPH